MNCCAEGCVVKFYLVLNLGVAWRLLQLYQSLTDCLNLFLKLDCQHSGHEEMWFKNGISGC